MPPGNPVPERLFANPHSLFEDHVSRVLVYADHEPVILALLRREFDAAEVYPLDDVRVAGMDFFKGERAPGTLDRFDARESVSGYEIVLAPFLASAEHSAEIGEGANLSALRTMVSRAGLPWIV